MDFLEYFRHVFYKALLGLIYGDLMVNRCDMLFLVTWLHIRCTVDCRNNNILQLFSKSENIMGPRHLKTSRAVFDQRWVARCYLAKAFKHNIILYIWHTFILLFDGFRKVKVNYIV